KTDRSSQAILNKDEVEIGGISEVGVLEITCNVLEIAGVFITKGDGEGSSAGCVSSAVTPARQETSNTDKTIGRKIDCLNINLISPIFSSMK
ncbi:MAG: hypothetical protein MUO64_16375, partial [Anaerolineales bacterium]|nr:hypothetical protein [Anaerolineales bacterium]